MQHFLESPISLAMLVLAVVFIVVCPTENGPCCACRGNTKGQVALADRMRVQKSSRTSVLNDLERKGSMRRRRRGDDRREHHLFLKLMDIERGNALATAAASSFTRR
jgi:DNA-binding MarR family transcriptional regulator